MILKKKFIIFVLLQVFVLCYMAVSQYAVEWIGQEVRLKTAPVDPRDLLYGDYVILNYEISDIPASYLAIQGQNKPKRGDKLWVVVRQEGNYHQLVSAHLKKPSVSENEVILKGKINYVSEYWDPEKQENTRIQSVRVLYGFERYYVPEGTGKELEDKRGQFDVIVKVAPWGQNLSSLTFIATGVMTQWEIQEQIYKHFDSKGSHIQIVHTRLFDQYEGREQPVWVADITIYGDKADPQEERLVQVILDAKTGEILLEK
ncbi:GDYXXLXY domain-containing protein [Ammoniphilus sp. YIM 78166]|uniref:GDYXXLXY domain-containing protein n=1 Tax=Ammoniphilus sp. YIM 78166 TaxID=1644106 RepID=UPI00106FA58A|nr:GDYXXLXY domain-containing protein [Ammoniphilus sp. YIM 78166]